MNAQSVPPFERRKTDLLDDPIDEDILREIREATDDSEKRRLMIDYQINRGLWKLGALVAEIGEKINRQDETFEAHRAEIKAILDAANREYEAHRKEFLKHATDEEKLISNGQTAYRTTMRVVGIVATVIIGMGGMILRGHFDELDATKKDLAEAKRLHDAQNVDLRDLQGRVKLLDDAMGRHLNSPRYDIPSNHGGIRLPDR